MMNTRTPNADFGNCNALILRCAQPKCASGGCTSMDIAYPIVSGCVMASSECKAHGDMLVQSISAQIVANSTARASAQATAAQTAAAQVAAAQSEQQMQQMQAQMQQMQTQMAQQSAQSAAAVQQALEEQKQLMAQQASEAAAREAAAAAASPAASVESAAALGVSADVLAREQASGQIMTQLENAGVALTALKKTMQTTFDYAGCDANGNNCTGPKRVRAFKQKANDFFDPYENVLDEVYDALIMAQSLGVDITDIYMMLNGSCNVWGKYMCQRCSASSEGKITDNESTSEAGCTCIGDNCYYDVKKFRAADGSIKVASRQEYCTLTQMLSSQDEVQQNWTDMEVGSSGGIRVACASDAIENSTLFRNRKKQATIDIETLQRIIEQDAPNSFRTADDVRNATRFCSVDDDDITKLQLLTQKKALTSTGGGWGRVCVADKSNQMYPKGVYATSLTTAGGLQDCAALGKATADGITAPTNDAPALATAKKNASDAAIRNCEEQNTRRKQNCTASGGTWEHGCRCPDDKEYRAERCLDILVASPSDTYTDSAGITRYSDSGEEVTDQSRAASARQNTTLAAPGANLSSPATLGTSIGGIFNNNNLSLFNNMGLGRNTGLLG